MKKEAVHTIADLRQKQALPLSAKLAMTRLRIREWIDEFGVECVYVAFSGGKDSTVLLHIVRDIYPNVQAVFIDTGLEFPEIRDFVKGFDNVEWLKPEMNFKKVVQKYGYPFISKEISSIIGGGQRSLSILKQEGIDVSDVNNIVCECSKRFKSGKGEWRRLAQCYGCVTKNNEFKTNPPEDERGRYSDIPQKYKFLMEAPFIISNRCCDVMKKTPAHKFEKRTGKHPITAQMASESKIREKVWLENGCNMFNLKHPISNPMSFWTEQDVLRYIKENNIPICSVYGEIVPDYSNTQEMEGQLDIADIGLIYDNRPLKTTGMRRTGCMFCGYGCHLGETPSRFELMKKTHPKQYEFIMKPVENGGLDYKSIIDWMNDHGGFNIKY